MDEDNDNKARRPARKRREYAPRAPRPLDAAQLQDLALGYAARYATTAAKLRRYLTNKLRERDWTPADPADIDALVARIVALGFVDDRAFAASRARDLTARGFGMGRVRGALAAAGVSKVDAGAALTPEDDGVADPFVAAIAFARRRHFGPFAREMGSKTSNDPARQRRELAAMARAGHDFGVARRVLMAADETAALALAGAE